LFDAVILHEPLSKMEKEEGQDRYPRLGAAVREAIQRNYGICYQKESASVYGRLPRNQSESRDIACQLLNLH
jgi:hypothetical protein